MVHLPMSYNCCLCLLHRATDNLNKSQGMVRWMAEKWNKIISCNVFFPGDAVERQIDNASNPYTIYRCSMCCSMQSYWWLIIFHSLWPHHFYAISFYSISLYFKANNVPYSCDIDVCNSCFKAKLCGILNNEPKYFLSWAQFVYIKTVFLLSFFLFHVQFQPYDAKLRWREGKGG